MRVHKFAAPAIAVAACGSVAVAVAGPSLAAVNAPDPDMSVVVTIPSEAPKSGAAAQQQQLDAVGQLGEVLTLISRIGKEARSKTPDVAALKDMQQRLRAATGHLSDSLRQSPPTRGRTATDPVGDVQDLLKKLGAAVQKLIAAAEKNDTAGVQAAINEALTVVKDLLAKLPLTGAGSNMPLPVPLPL
ncbi:hypothetical protein GO001_11395 [Streptomyces sp. NRRL B-1677]|uniref:Secreted protein n=1 Tax=Streptomyces klenkii TaxID=1420899 RepID=A0A3B0BYY1_9ACTN|nr:MULTISPECIES: hypothetical protein [Streptomyces]MBF6045822.1 hypothetical protein [Streptomyces sp. NRRL B-1677]RKN76506.1 hypothetical protein D7231_05840 [Streptomyces klenkii]